MNQPIHESAAGLAYIFGTIFFSVYGQIVVKWQVVKAGSLPTSFFQKILFLADLVLNPWIISTMAAGFFALVCWLAAMTKFELSYAYPILSLTFVFVLIFSALLLHEALTAAKVLGVLLVIAGIIVASRG